MATEHTLKSPHRKSEEAVRQYSVTPTHGILQSLIEFIVCNLQFYFGKTGSTSATLYVVVPIVTSDSLIGRKYVNGGYNTSFSPGYTLKKLMSAPCDMKLLDTNLNSSGDLLHAATIKEGPLPN